MRNIPGFLDAPSAWGTAVGIIGAAIFFMFVFFEQVEMGKIAAFSSIAIFFTLGFCWKYRGLLWFQFFIVLAIGAHLAVIFLGFLEGKHGASLLFYGPLVVFDAIAMVLIVQGLAKTFRH